MSKAKSDIPQARVDAMMVKCGRRCCICRRYRPTKLQVHHIQERSKGGSDEEDNLIVTCLSCHSDVHTQTLFARRFTEAELKSHRDETVRAVAEGRFPDNDVDDTDEVIRRILNTLRAAEKPTTPLLPEAVELLTCAASVQDMAQGSIVVAHHGGEISFIIGGGERLIDRVDKRTQAKYKRALEQLVATGLVEHLGRGAYEVTYEGYLAADELAIPRGDDQ
jgi:hypothetical protein